MRVRLHPLTAYITNNVMYAPPWGAGGAARLTTSRARRGHGMGLFGRHGWAKVSPDSRKCVIFSADLADYDPIACLVCLSLRCLTQIRGAFQGEARPAS